MGEIEKRSETREASLFGEESCSNMFDRIKIIITFMLSNRISSIFFTEAVSWRCSIK